jgi:hypothetical protein
MVHGISYWVFILFSYSFEAKNLAPAQLFDMSNLNIIGYAGCTGYVGYVGYTCLEMVSNWNMYHGDCCNGEVWEATFCGSVKNWETDDQS